MDEKGTLKELIKASNVIKQKYDHLKNLKSTADEQIEKTFKPVTKQLKEIARNTKKRKLEISNENPKTKVKKENKNDNEYNDSNHDEDNDDDGDDDDGDDDDDDDQEQNYNDDNKSLSQKFLSLLHNNDKSIDVMYGVNYDEESKTYKIGSLDCIPNGNNFYFNSKNYIGTNGLFELLFLKNPAAQTEEDLEVYGDILITSNVCRRNFDPKQQIRGSSSLKYRNIIKPLIEKHRQNNRSHTGSGLSITTMGPTMKNLPKEKFDYVYWDDPNEIVERLRLLISSTSAGHNAHNNEILSIIEELREANVIV